MARADLLARAAVVALATATTALGAPAPVTGTLTLVGLGLAVERLARLRRRGVLDLTLVVVGGVVVALVLVGLVLGATAVGLGRDTWTYALAGLAAALLAGSALVPRPAAYAVPAAGPLARRLVWPAVGVLVAAGAVSLSAQSVARTERPPVQMYLGDVRGTTVPVVVTASERTRPLEIRATRGDTDLSFPLIRVPADGKVRTTLALPTTGRYVITLNYPDQTKPLRTLVLDR